MKHEESSLKTTGNNYDRFIGVNDRKLVNFVTIEIS